MDPLPQELPVSTKEYGDMHKMVLQGLMAAGFLDAKGVKDLFLRICTTLNMSDNDKQDKSNMMYVQKIVREINDAIKTFDMAIRSACCELTGKKYYIFLVTVEKPIMKMQQRFSKCELELFKRIMNEVLTQYENYAVPFMHCINMASEIDGRNFSKVQAEEFINDMIKLLYFAKYIPDPKDPETFEVTLGVRAIREFEPVFRQSYGDAIQNCYLCKMIMLHGLECRKCDANMHRACLEKYKKTCQTCPSCRVDWKVENALVKRKNSSAVKNSNTEGASGSQKSRKAVRRSNTPPRESESPERITRGILSRSSGGTPSARTPATKTTTPLETLDSDSTPPAPKTSTKRSSRGKAPVASTSKITSRKTISSDESSDNVPAKKQTQEPNAARPKRNVTQTQNIISSSESSDASSTEMQPTRNQASVSTKPKRAVTQKTVPAEKSNEDMPVLELMLPATRKQPQQRKGKEPTTAKTTSQPRKTRVVRKLSSTSEENEEDEA